MNKHAVLRTTGSHDHLKMKLNRYMCLQKQATLPVITRFMLKDSAIHGVNTFKEQDGFDSLLLVPATVFFNFRLSTQHK